MTQRDDLRSDWANVPLRHLLRKLVRTVRPDDGVVTAYRDGRVALRQDRRIDGYTFADQEGGYQGVEPGDFVFHGLDGFAGAMGVCESRGKCTPVYHVCAATNRAEPRYLAYALRAMATSGFLAVQAGNVRQRSVDFRNWDNFARLSVRVPSVRVQQAIVELLDDECTRLDTMITARRREIDLVQDHLRAVINLALSGEPGIRRAGQLPQSPISVKWPGPAVQRDWKVVPFWSLASRRNDVGSEADQLLSVYLDRGVIPHSDEGTQVHAPSLDRSAYQLVGVGDLVMNNQQAWRGSVAVSFLSGVVSPAYLVFRLSDALDPRFANYLFRSSVMVEQYAQISRGVGSIQRQLTPGDLRVLRVPVPPRSVQLETSEKLDSAGRLAANVATLVSRQIDLLVEHRQALIASAVTGVLDVAVPA